MALRSRGQVLIAVGRTPEAIVDLSAALDITRPTGDPAMFVYIAATLLAVEGNKPLALEAYAAVQRISAALPDDEMRQSVAAAEPVRQIVSSIR